MRKHFIITKESQIPLIGVHVFGLIDRGTNIIQVRPITGCPLNCIYCSVDEGPSSKKPNTYQVETDYLIEEFNKLVEFKESDEIEAHIDGVGEPVLDKNIVKLVQGIKQNKNVKTISMQTNGVLLNETLIKQLAKSGLSRINLSINTLNQTLAKKMTGTNWYNIELIKENAKLIVKYGIDLLIAPVLVPKYNEDLLNDLINFSKKLGAKLGIQKYERQKHGRRLKVKEQTWFKFTKLMEKLEQEHDYQLVLSKKDFNIQKIKSLSIIFKKNDTVKSKVVLPGWLKNEVIINYKNRLITVFNSTNKIGDLVKAKIVKTKHNLYLAKKI